MGSIRADSGKRISLRWKMASGESGTLCVGNRSYQIQRHSSWPLLEILNKYSEIYEGLAKYFYIDDVNFAHLFNYFIFFSSPYFVNPGLDIIISYLNLLDKHIKGDVGLEVEDIYQNSFRECAEVVCKRKRVQLKVVREAYHLPKKKLLLSNPTIFKNALVARLFTRLLIGKARKLFGKISSKDAEVLILGNIRFSARDERNNSVFGGIIQGLEKRGISHKLIRYEQLTQTMNLKRFLKNFFSQSVPYIGDYYSFSHIQNCERDFKRIRKIWNEIKQRKEVQSLFEYKGYNFYEVISPRLELVFNGLSYIAADTKNIARQISRQEKFKVLLLDHEDNMLGKGFMLNSRTDSKRKTLALSYELIYPGCNHTHAKNLAVLDRKSALWRPLPDVKCVWGEYAREVLLKHCNYKDSIIKVTGDPRFDALNNLKINKPEIIGKYSLSQKPKILFASQARSIMYPIIKGIAEQNPGFEVVIKPHPKEDMKSLLSFFGKDKPGNITIVGAYSPLYELISVSDIVTTKDSTAGFEATLMGKRTIYLNFNREKRNGIPFTKYGAGAEAKSFEDFNELARKGMAEKNQGALSFIYAKNDGNATKRVLEEIYALLRG